MYSLSGSEERSNYSPPPAYESDSSWEDNGFSSSDGDSGEDRAARRKKKAKAQRGAQQAAQGPLVPVDIEAVSTAVEKGVERAIAHLLDACSQDEICLQAVSGEVISRWLKLNLMILQELQNRLVAWNEEHSQVRAQHTSMGFASQIAMFLCPG